MAEKQYLDLTGLQDVAGHVNTRLKTVTTIPVSADNGAVRLYVGATTNTYTNGHIYQYDLTNTTWKDITNFSIIFTGTQAEWNNLSLVEKQAYDICNITDDSSSGVVSGGDMDSSVYDPNSTVANAGGIVDYVEDKFSNIIAEEFDSTATYTKDDYCMYNGLLYKFNKSHTGAWSSSDADETLVSDEFDAGSNTDYVELTQAQYDLLTPAEKTNGILYFITDSQDADDIQYSIMPTASIDYLNKIVQYIGITTSSYTNGYFYKCVFNDPSYAWENIQVNSIPTASTSVLGGVKIDGLTITIDQNGVISSNSSSIPSEVKSTKTAPTLNSYWLTKSWSGISSINGASIWTDGEEIYYSSSTNQYVLNKSTGTWSSKTWTGLTSFNGAWIWNDGENIYYSRNGSNYVLNKSTSTWSTKTWTGLTNIDGSAIWSDGENIYLSAYSDQYVLDKSNSSWSAKTWNGATPTEGLNVWTDGKDIYYSSGTTQKVLDVSTSTWSDKTWSGLTDFDGSFIWTDGENIYYSNDTNQYVLNKSTSTWSIKTWSGLTNLNGIHVWTDGENIYYSSSSSQYVLANKVIR